MKGRAIERERGKEALDAGETWRCDRRPMDRKIGKGQWSYRDVW